MVRHLVNCARRKDVLGVQRLFEITRGQHISIAVRIRVADIERGRRRIAGHDRTGFLANFGKGLIPADLLPVPAHPLHRAAEAVGIILEIGNGGGLGADVPPAHRIVGIALDREDVTPLRCHDHPAIGLADMACAAMGDGHGGSPVCFLFSPYDVAGRPSGQAIVAWPGRWRTSTYLQHSSGIAQARHGFYLISWQDAFIVAKSK